MIDFLTSIFDSLSLTHVNSIIGITGILVTVMGWNMWSKMMEKMRKKSSTIQTDNLLNDNAEKKRGGKKSKSKIKKIPDLLPHLPDFKEQEDELDEVILGWNYEGLSRSDKHRPLLCFLQSDSNEDSGIMERLKRYFAVQLNFDNDYNSIEEMYIHSNDFIESIHLDSTNFHKTPDLQKEIWRRLKEKLVVSHARRDWKAQLVSKLSDKEHPIFIHTTLDIANLKNKDKARDFISTFIHFWYKEWSIFIDQQINEKHFSFDYPIVVCLLFRYKKTVEKKFLRKSKTLAFELLPLNFSEFSTEYHAYGTILSKLSKVEKNHVTAWVINYKATICEYCDIDKVQTEIEKLYAESTHIPMKILASELKRILENT